MPRRKQTRDDEIIVIDRRDPPVFVMSNSVIDLDLGVEAVAVYAFVRRRGPSSVEAVAAHFGIGIHHVSAAFSELSAKGLARLDDED